MHRKPLWWRNSFGQNIWVLCYLVRGVGAVQAKGDDQVGKFKGSETERNLLTAFAGESQANRRYLAFAKQADKEGFRQVAKLFRAAAEAETVHALAHLRTLGQVKSTAENLKEAVAGETDERRCQTAKTRALMGKGELLCSAPRNRRACALWKLWSRGTSMHTVPDCGNLPA